MDISILVAVKDEKLTGELVQFLDRKAVKVFCVNSLDSAFRTARREKPGIALIDAPRGNGEISLLREFKKQNPSIQLLLLTEGSGAEVNPDILTIGVRSFIPGPANISAVSPVVSVAIANLRKRKAQDELLKVSQKEFGFDRIIGRSEGLIETLNLATKVSDSDATSVLISGESGTGKELIARAIHTQSKRKNGPFIEINCAAIPGNLLESELFGHEIGAFTDAKSEKTGLFEMADGGTIFLDEIGELGFELQAKLLKFLDTKTMRRVAGSVSITVDARIIAATNRDLRRDVEEKRFREDLYYRLNVVELKVPPLRERGDDVVLLASHFMEQFANEMRRPVVQLSRDAVAALIDYHWPGNVRELMNLIERAVLLSNGGVIESSDLPIMRQVENQIHSTVRAGSGGIVIEFPDEGITLDAMEKKLIETALEKSGWNVVKTARLLGVGRGTLRYRMRKHRLEPRVEESLA